MSPLPLDANDAAELTEQAVAGGADALVRWLARRLDAGVGLTDPDGAMRTWHTAGGPGRAVLSSDIVHAAAGSSVVVVNGQGWRAHVAGAGTSGCSLVVVAADSGHGAGGDRALIGHAARLAGLCLASQIVLRLRETVFQLLMKGHADAAQAVTVTAGPRLPDTVCVCLVEGPAAERDKTAPVLEAMAGAWVVRCPVHARHNIVLLAAEGTGTAALDQADRALAGLHTAFPDAVIGASWPVPLSDAAYGYYAAADALPEARCSDSRMARSAGSSSLAGVLGPAARRWAAHKLGPLLSYRPSRPQDPGGRVLLESLTGRLDLGTAGASRMLHLHRNTLDARVHLAARLLGADLTDPAQCAALRLAASLIAKPEAAGAGPVPELGELLGEPAVQDWADRLLEPLRADPDPRLLPAVRAWLEAGRQATDKAAESSGVSVRGMRRRIKRAELLLSRSLTGDGPGPYDMYLAMAAAHQDQSPLVAAETAEA